MSYLVSFQPVRVWHSLYSLFVKIATAFCRHAKIMNTLLLLFAWEPRQVISCMWKISWHENVLSFVYWSMICSVPFITWSQCTTQVLLKVFFFFCTRTAFSIPMDLAVTMRSAFLQFRGRGVGGGGRDARPHVRKVSAALCRRLRLNEILVGEKKKKKNSVTKLSLWTPQKP